MILNRHATLRCIPFLTNLRGVDRHLVVRHRQDVEYEFRPNLMFPNHLLYCRPGIRAVFAGQIEENIHLFVFSVSARRSGQQA